MSIQRRALLIFFVFYVIAFAYIANYIEKDYPFFMDVVSGEPVEFHYKIFDDPDSGAHKYLLMKVRIHEYGGDTQESEPGDPSFYYWLTEFNRLIRDKYEVPEQLDTRHPIMVAWFSFTSFL